MDKIFMVILTAVIAFGTLAAAFFAFEAYQFEVVKYVAASAK